MSWDDPPSEAELAQRLDAARETARSELEYARARYVQLRGDLRNAELVLESRAASAFSEGRMTVAEVARRSSLSAARVSQVLRESGVRRHTLTEAMARAIVPQWAGERYEPTASPEEIAERIDETGDFISADHGPTSPKTIRQTARRNPRRFRLSTDGTTIRLLGPRPERP